MVGQINNYLLPTSPGIISRNRPAIYANNLVFLNPLPRGIPNLNRFLHSGVICWSLGDFSCFRPPRFLYLHFGDCPFTTKNYLLSWLMAPIARMARYLRSSMSLLMWPIEPVVFARYRKTPMKKLLPTGLPQISSCQRQACRNSPNILILLIRMNRQNS